MSAPPPPRRPAIPVAQPVAQPVAAAAARGNVAVAAPLPIAAPLPRVAPAAAAAAVPPVSLAPVAAAAPPAPVASSAARAPTALPVASPVPVAAPVSPSGHPLAAVAASPAAASSVSSSSPLPVATPVRPLSSPLSADEVEARLLLELPDCAAYVLRDGSKKLLTRAPLQLLCSAADDVDEGSAGHAGEGGEVYVLLVGSLRLALRLAVPCLQLSDRDFVFPTNDATYGLSLSESVSEDLLDVLRLVLAERTSFRTAAEPAPLSSLPDAPDRVSSAASSVAAGLGAGSMVVATGVIRGGQMVGRMLTSGGQMLTRNIKPNEKPTQVKPETREKVARAKAVSGAAVKLSKAVVLGAVAATDALASQLSAAVKDTDVGRKLANDGAEPSARVEAAKQVGRATLDAVLHVYAALETAVFGVASDAAAAAVTVVSHRYGEDAGDATKEGLGVVSNVAVAAKNVKSIGIKAIAKKTAVKAGREVLTTNKERQEEEERKAAAAQAQPVLGQALGLPPGVDPLVAAEALQAAAQLSAAATPYLAPPAAAASSSRAAPSVTVATAVATGPTAAEAEAKAKAAAMAAANAK